jgi:hypothetical protein
MDITNTPPVSMTEKCVECDGNISEGEVIASCAYLCGSLHPECEPNHNARKKHPDVPLVYRPAGCVRGHPFKETKIMEQNSSKLVLDLVSAILCNGVLAGGGAKTNPKAAAKTFFKIRDELLQGMEDSEHNDLPTYLSQKFPRTSNH